MLPFPAFLDIGRDVGHVGPAHLPVEGMGRHAKADVGLIGPVLAVVARLEGAFGITGNLVVMKTIVVHGVVDRPGHGFRRLVWRQLPLPFLQAGFELRPLFDDEAVNGRVDDGQLRQALHVAADIGQGLARQAVHEVQGQVVDAGIVSRLDGRFPLSRRVDPAQEGQHGVGKDWTPRLRRLTPQSARAAALS